MASPQAAKASIEEVSQVTSEEPKISPTVEEKLTPTDPKHNVNEDAILSDEENVKDFDEDDENAEGLSPINQESDPNASFGNSGFTEFNEGDDKEDVADEEDEDN